MDINERIQLIVNQLFNGNKAQFSKAINEPVTTVNNILGERKTIPSSKFIGSIHNSIENINLEWVVNGVGEMLKEEIKLQELPKTEIDKPLEKEGSHSNLSNEHAFITRLLPLSAMGGSMSGFAVDGVMLQDCELIVSPVKNVDFAITVYGESMSPEYPSGSRVLIKKINPDIFIDWGRTYVLDTANGVVVKEVHASDKEGHISCHSINPDPKFKPFDVPLNEVYGMYRVLMCLSAK